MDLRWCWNAEVGLPEPDAVFYLTLSDEASARRDGFGDERYEVSDFQRKVKINYSKIRNSLWQVCIFSHVKYFRFLLLIAETVCCSSTYFYYESNMPFRS